MDILNLWTLWPITGPWQLTSLSGGANNRAWRADSVDGQSYVLRLALDVAREAHMRYETALLEALAQKQLPFRLPLPLKANNGDLIVLCEQETGAPALATLYPFLPGGKLTEWGDQRIASAAGATLAQLDMALATLSESQLPADFQTPTAFGDLAHYHPHVPDPLVAVEKLPIAREQAQQLCTLLADVIEKAPDLYRRLPRQLLHRDYDPSNILIADQQVTAVLDFEFVGPDIRVLDLCVALSWWPVDLMGTGQEWELIDTFATAYMAHLHLSEEELRAIPAVLRLRDATSLVHRIGRYLAGLETDARIQRRVQHSLWREAWLCANQETLLQHALSWR